MVDTNMERPPEIPSLVTQQQEIDRLRAELDNYQKAAPLCDKHKPDGGARAGCMICYGHELSAALSRIDYLCGPPNEMEVSEYDLHCEPELVVKAVERLRAAYEEEKEIVDRVWNALGITDYAGAKGKSIDQIVRDLRAVNAQLVEALAKHLEKLKSTKSSAEVRFGIEQAIYAIRRFGEEEGPKSTIPSGWDSSTEVGGGHDL